MTHTTPASASTTRTPAGTERTRKLASDDRVIHMAMKILEERLGTYGVNLANPAVARNYLTLKLAELEHEVFGVVYLDSQHRVIGSEELFRGTIDGASVYPREVVKASLANNAAAVIFYHNHPSGEPEPSLADRQITRRLTDALALVDIRVLDHIIVGGTKTVAFSERGLL